MHAKSPASHLEKRGLLLFKSAWWRSFKKVAVQGDKVEDEGVYFSVND